MSLVQGVVMFDLGETINNQGEIKDTDLVRLAGSEPVTYLFVG